MIEMKIVMALVVRTFDIEAAYTELDATSGGKRVKRTVERERAYQLGIGEPSGNLPRRVKMVTDVGK